VEAQIEGGVLMGVGYALSEQFKIEQGVNLTDTLHKCGLPTAGSAPEVIPVLVEVPHPGGPLGAKGLGETPPLAATPAILNAIFDAVGVRIRDLPATPARIRSLLR
jgi:CO/xanthine dehydrogenase Mo-binding subunit